jgi:hypothetical protein
VQNDIEAEALPRTLEELDGELDEVGVLGRVQRLLKFLHMGLGGGYMPGQGRRIG